jgi:hypothetical protein
MATKTYHLELRVLNISDPDRMRAVDTAVRRAARELMARTILICGSKPTPDVSLYSESFDEGRVEHKIMEE